MTCASFLDHEDCRQNPEVYLERKKLTSVLSFAKLRTTGNEGIPRFSAFGIFHGRAVCGHEILSSYSYTSSSQECNYNVSRAVMYLQEETASCKTKDDDEARLRSRPTGSGLVGVLSEPFTKPYAANAVLQLSHL